MYYNSFSVTPNLLFDRHPLSKIYKIFNKTQARCVPETQAKFAKRRMGIRMQFQDNGFVLNQRPAITN